jgi:tetratricopeptide (TPR) repeat protein
MYISRFIHIKTMLTKNILLTFFLISNYHGFSQSAKYPQIDDAHEHMKHGNYTLAIPIYKSELKKDPDNNKIKYKLGICYLNKRLNFEEALNFLKEASKDNKIEVDVWFHLGRAYHLTYRLEEAIGAFTKYKGLKPKKTQEVERLIAQCENAISLMLTPSRAAFQNLGKEINSEEPDYNPFISQDESFLVFTSRRKENIGGSKLEIDGYRSSDIYTSSLENGVWTRAKNVGRSINSNLDEQVVGLKSDASEIYIYKDHIDKFGDVYLSIRKEGNEYAKPKLFDPIINEKIETGLCENEEGNVLFFARREDIAGNSNIYMSRKLPNGKWGTPQKLPESVNSSYNEDQPFLSYDGETLYFASDGHNTMGGYDFFKSKWDRETNTFSKAENLGYPINSTDDERSISLTKDNKFAYVSAFRPNGYGDLDLYRVKLNESEPIVVIYTGKIFYGDSLNENQSATNAATITVTNITTNFEHHFLANTATGKYMMALPEGKYIMKILSPGFLKYKEEFEVMTIGQNNKQIEKNVLLKKNKKLQ